MLFATGAVMCVRILRVPYASHWNCAANFYGAIRQCRKNGRWSKDIRLQTQSNPEGEHDGEGDGGQEVAREFVVTGGDTSEVL